MPYHLDDVQSDFSVLHRIEEIGALPGPRFFAYASRLWTYQGAVAAAYRRQQATREQRAAAGPVSLGEWARTHPAQMQAAYERAAEGR